MKIAPGQSQVEVPGLYQVLTVAVSEEPRHDYMFALMRITLEQYHKLLDMPDQKVGTPRYYTQSGETIYFWPASDVECELEIQYHTHVMRA